MGRSLLKRCLVLSLASLVITSSNQATSLIGTVAGKLVSDPASHAYLGPIMQMTGDSLKTVQKMTGEMTEMNSVLGSKLPQGWIQKVMQVGGLSGDFNSLLSSLTGQGGDPLMQLNYMGVQHGGKQDFSNYIYAKNYFQQKFFPEQSITTPTQLSQIRESKLEAVQVSTVDSLAIATQQKKTLRDDHLQLQNIKMQAEQNTTLQYQTNVQTRLLEHIAHQLDKLILLQSQQLELMATNMAQMQPTVFKGAKAPIKKG
ncbi:MAG: hypothetical protein J0H87_09255 [Holosporales bacterium]|nr:hypothetical protein [Holosporales bacterium]